MHAPRLIIYVAGWAAVTATATFVMWQGMRPLIGGSAGQVPAGPAMTTSAVPTPAPSSASPVPSRSPRAVQPRPSMYEQWAYSQGVFTRTFDVTGGTATVRIAGGEVHLVSSSTRDGYRITPRQPSPTRLVLEFFKPGGQFTIVDAMWWEGRPYAEVTRVGE